VVIRALAHALLVLPGLGRAESLTLSFVPHPAHEEVVVGEMIPVTLRAVYDRKIARDKMEIAPSSSFDWIQVDRDRWQEEMIDGKSWITMNRELAIFPKRSGPLEFGPATHDLTIIDEKSQRQERRIVAHPLAVSVGAYPQERGWKLAAAEVTLTDELDTDPARLQDGQTVTRRVTLRAKGVLPEALPPRPILGAEWLITFAAPQERKLILTEAGPVAEVVWLWQFRPLTGEPGVLDGKTIRFFNTTTREMDAVEIAPLSIAYASFFTSQVETGRFGGADRLAEAAALGAGLLAGTALVLRTQVPQTSRTAFARLLRRRSPVTRWRIGRAARSGELLRLRRLVAETYPEAGEATAALDRAIYSRGGGFDAERFLRDLRRRR
jgi:hypothetical protein